MDEPSHFNKARFEELAAANVEYARPALALDAETPRRLVDSHGVMGDVRGKNVLCLASVARPSQERGNIICPLCRST